MSDQSLVDKFDDTVFEELDSPPSSEPQTPITGSGRCKMVAVVRPPLPSDVQEAPAPSGPSLSSQKRKTTPAPSARLKKRTLASTADKQAGGTRKVGDKTRHFRKLKKECMYQELRVKCITLFPPILTLIMSLFQA